MQKLINPRSGHGMEGLAIIPVAIVGLIAGWPVLLPVMTLITWLFPNKNLTYDQHFAIIVIFGFLGFLVQSYVAYGLFTALKAWWNQ